MIKLSTGTPKVNVKLMRAECGERYFKDLLKKHDAPLESSTSNRYIPPGDGSHA